MKTVLLKQLFLVGGVSVLIFVATPPFMQNNSARKNIKESSADSSLTNPIPQSLPYPTVAPIQAKVSPINLPPVELTKEVSKAKKPLGVKSKNAKSFSEPSIYQLPEKTAPNEEVYIELPSEILNEFDDLQIEPSVGLRYEIYDSTDSSKYGNGVQ